jgi:hypothetical protein
VERSLSGGRRPLFLQCFLALFLLVTIGFFALSATTSPVLITTYHNNLARWGSNLSETILTPSNVNSSQFGKLFSYSLDGATYAQPLYVPNVSISGKGTHNVVFVATEHDSVYAFDADSNSGGNSTALWTASFINPTNGITAVPWGDVNCFDIQPEMGITGTPVIDPSTNTLYVVANTKENGQYFQRLHALDITSGAEKFGAPATIQATVNGTGEGSSGGKISFDPLNENQRPGLMLYHGAVIITWAAHCDHEPTHGWVIAYNARTLKQVAVWNASPDAGLAGIWQSGGAPAADSTGNVYFATGNGNFDVNNGDVDYGDTIIKLGAPAGVVTVLDYFTPYDQSSMNEMDNDLGAGGVTLLPNQPPGSPHQHLLIQAGKEGTIYLIDRDNMGKYNPSNNDQIVQSLPFAIGIETSTPAWWNNTVYFAATGDYIKAFAFDPGTGLLSTSPSSESSTSYNFPGATPSISANENSEAILWALQTDAAGKYGSTILHAYDATNLGNELYNSNQNFNRDNPGTAIIFTVPTIANGKVYVGTRYQLSVFGLL